MKIHLSNIPKELKQLKQWVIYNQEKVPLTRGGPASSTDPNTWLSYSDAVNLMSSYNDCGLGFVFSKDDPYVGIDLDKCLDTASLPPTVASFVQLISDTLWPYSYREISPSGRGIHYFVKGDLSTIRWTNQKHIEVYDQGRYFTMTGRDGAGDILPAQSQLRELFHTPQPKPKRKPLKASIPLRSLIHRWNIDVWEEREVKMNGETCTGYTVQCPWQAGHSTKNAARDAIIAEDAEGRRYFHCFHASCAGRHWRDFRELYDPKTKEIAQSLRTKPNHDWIGEQM